ncbi:MAG TPA: molybdopterin cofactor-binding domain-containing protein, partial [Caulobacteraceae bacterium]|nr:molybdopterin cofactor-binding domain-containing protein [Caulobacteraceae bacterium]
MGLVKERPAPSRRAVVAAGLTASGGFAVAASLPGSALADGVPSIDPVHGVTLASDEIIPPDELSAFLVVHKDSSVLVRLPHQEMGQGTSTALAMLAAEELACDWSKVRMEYASSNRNAKSKNVYGRQMTVGSQGVRSSVSMMQQAGASARVRLVEAAAKRWGVPPDACGCAGGKVTHMATGRTLHYGDLCADAAGITLDKEPLIKTPDQFTLVGKWTPRLDTAPKLNGEALYGIDAKVPGMVNAAVLSCPEFGGKLASVDETPAKGMPGVIAVVKLDDAVAVVADRYWRAKAALAKLRPLWASGGNSTVDSAGLAKAYRDALDGPLISARRQGDIAAGLATPGAQVIEALYEVPYLAHAPMEPMNATVWLQPKRVDVWIGTQSPMDVLETTAQEAGVDKANVYVHNQFVGGGFGRRSKHDELVQAIAVAKVVNRPVKLIWSREQDIRRDRYRPQAAMRFKAAIKDGKAQAMDCQVAVGSLLKSLAGGAAKFPPSFVEPMAVEVVATHSYRIPALQVSAVMKNAHVPVMFWRSVGASQNTFFLESFVDEMAHAAGQDPYHFRRAMLDRADYLGVLDMLADKGDWAKPLEPGPAGSRRGRGISIVDTYA